MNNFSGNENYPTATPPETVPRWDFLTNHAHVLLCISRDPGIRLRDIAAAVGITERSAHKVLAELVEEGYVLRERRGRRNHYRVKPEQPLRHPLVREREVGKLLKALLGAEGPAQEADVGATKGTTSDGKQR